MAKKTTMAGMSLVECLKKAGESDLKEIDAEMATIDEKIETLENERRALARAKKLITTKDRGPVKRLSEEERTTRLEAMHGYLEKNGPSSQRAITEATGIATSWVLTNLKKHPWFVKTAAGWGLSNDQRAALDDAHGPGAFS